MIILCLILYVLALLEWGISVTRRQIITEVEKNTVSCHDGGVGGGLKHYLLKPYWSRLFKNLRPMVATEIKTCVKIQTVRS